VCVFVCLSTKNSGTGRVLASIISGFWRKMVGRGYGPDNLHLGEIQYVQQCRMGEGWSVRIGPAIPVWHWTLDRRAYRRKRELGILCLECVGVKSRSRDPVPDPYDYFYIVFVMASTSL